MVSFSKLGSMALISGAALVSAATYHVNIDYEEYLDVYFHYRNAGDAVSVQPDATGLTVTINSDANSESDCEILRSGMLVYAADGGADKTLVTWNQYEVFHLIFDGQELSYSGVNAQSCGGGDVSASVPVTKTTINTDIPTKTVGVDDIDNPGILTELAPCSRTITVTENGIPTTMVSYCPINTIYGNSVVTVTASGVVTSYTTYCPISEVVIHGKPRTVTKTITSCGEHTCTATTSEEVTNDYVKVTQSANPDNSPHKEEDKTYKTVDEAGSTEYVDFTTITGEQGSVATSVVTQYKTADHEQGTVLTTSAGKTNGDVEVYQGQANFVNINKLAVGIMAVGAALI